MGSGSHNLARFGWAAVEASGNEVRVWFKSRGAWVELAIAL